MSQMMKTSEHLSRALADSPMPSLQYENRRVFVDSLRFGHALMVATETLLEEAAARLPPGRLRAYYVEQLEQEHRCAGWLTEDLAFLGVMPATHQRAAMLAGSQYYHVRHTAPEMLLGYMAALAHRPAPPAILDALTALYGASAMRTIAYDAEHHREHSAQLLDEIDALPADLGGLVVYNAYNSAQLLRICFADIGRVPLPDLRRQVAEDAMGLLRPARFSLASGVPDPALFTATPSGPHS